MLVIRMRWISKTNEPCNASGPTSEHDVVM